MAIGAHAQPLRDGPEGPHNELIDVHLPVRLVAMKVNHWNMNNTFGVQEALERWVSHDYGETWEYEPVEDSDFVLSYPSPVYNGPVEIAGNDLRDIPNPPSKPVGSTDFFRQSPEQWPFNLSALHMVSVGAETLVLRTSFIYHVEWFQIAKGQYLAEHHSTAWAFVSKDGGRTWANGKARFAYGDDLVNSPEFGTFSTFDHYDYYDQMVCVGRYRAAYLRHGLLHITPWWRPDTDERTVWYDYYYPKAVTVNNFDNYEFNGFETRKDGNGNDLPTLYGYQEKFGLIFAGNLTYLGRRGEETVDPDGLTLNKRAYGYVANVPVGPYDHHVVFLRSKDGGHTFQETHNFTWQTRGGMIAEGFGTLYSGISVYTGDDNILAFITMERNDFGASRIKGIVVLKSTDLGDTWKEISTIPVPSEVMASYGWSPTTEDWIAPTGWAKKALYIGPTVDKSGEIVDRLYLVVTWHPVRFGAGSGLYPYSATAGFNQDYMGNLHDGNFEAWLGYHAHYISTDSGETWTQVAGPGFRKDVLVTDGGPIWYDSSAYRADTPHTEVGKALYSLNNQYDIAILGDNHAIPGLYADDSDWY